MNALATGQFGRTVILREVAEAVSDSAGEVAQRQSSWREYRLRLFVTMPNGRGAYARSKRLIGSSVTWCAAIIVPSPFVHTHPAISLEKACFSSPQRGFEISFKHITILSKGGMRDMHLPTLTTFHQ
ncbi:hypothetical protein COCVIDRAFT_34663 [Bipolaris victoriae FI3]|uniref:Uncharacterized protein n=1 Tax=Bipolaris victoriae (strain FI3) TaxID=930091 RepID=W7EXH3_BIPV3|nr:hypothetical protein COCVIDRAFT_34663 [Bipolaris victoriae FI3]